MGNNDIKAKDTVKIIVPPSSYFEEGEHLHVIRKDQYGVWVPKEFADFHIGYENVEKVETNWVTVRCTYCNSVLFETEVDSFSPWSVRAKCRKCKQMIIVRGVKGEREVQSNANYRDFSAHEKEAGDERIRPILSNNNAPINGHFWRNRSRSSSKDIV